MFFLLCFRYLVTFARSCSEFVSLALSFLLSLCPLAREGVLYKLQGRIGQLSSLYQKVRGSQVEGREALCLERSFDATLDELTRSNSSGSGSGKRRLLSRGILSPPSLSLS